MQKPKQINIREFQHNLSMYMDMVRISPLYITRNGVEEAVLVNPNSYDLKKKKIKKNGTKKHQNIINSKFIGMYQNREDWKNKSNNEIARNLRDSAWYGK